MKRYWVSWWSRYHKDDGCTQPPFEFYSSGVRYSERSQEWDEESFIAWIEAQDEASIWEVIKRHFPDYEQRFCDEVELDWRPNNRFPDAIIQTLAAQ